MIAITTDRFHLRPFTPDDADDYYETIFANEAVAGTMTGIHHRPDRDSIDDMIRAYGMFWEANAFGPLAIVERGSGVFVGSCGLTNYRTDTPDEVELVYTVAQPYWGQRVGLEVCQAWLRYAFESLGVQRVVAYVFPQDEQTRRTLRRAGLLPLHETTVTAETVTTYVMTADDYQRPTAPYKLTTEA